MTTTLTANTPTRFAGSSQARGLAGHLRAFALAAIASTALGAGAAHAQLRVEISGAGASQYPIAVADFASPDPQGAEIANIIRTDLGGTGLFRIVDSSGSALSESSAIGFAAWKTRGADALAVGSANRLADGRIDVRYRLADTVQQSQLLLFAFLGSTAVGTMLGGLVGDRVGAKTVIWFSILGVLPFTLALPYADLNWTIGLSLLIGLILSSAFPAIVVFAQDLVPGRVGMVAGIFFGFAFGMAGIAAAVLGVLADAKGIDYVYQVCSYLPLIGLLTVFLPAVEGAQYDTARAA